MYASLARHALGLLVVAATTAACAGATDDGAGNSASDIQGGVVEANEPAVGLVSSAFGYCTGTLIAPNVVLTAGHCVTETVTSFSTTAGSNLPTEHHTVKSQLAFPGYQALGCPNTTLDIGLVLLDAPIAGITPKTFGGEITSGASCRAVGFGRHQEGTTLEREKSHSADETITSVATTSFEVTTGTGIADKGDSGGPLLCNDVVVGTVSCHTDGSGASHVHEQYAVVSGAATWIQQQIQAWAPVTAPPAATP